MPEDKYAALEKRLDRLESTLLGRFPVPPVFDPPPDDYPRWGGAASWWTRRPIPFPWPEPGDPVPIDISRLTKAQLQVSLESIKAQRIRLDAVEKMIQQQMKEAR